MAVDRFTSGIIQDALQAVGDEMFEALRRTSMSPIIYEALDFAVGATDAQGNLLAQGNGVTAFLGSLDSAVKGTLEHYDGGAGLRPGDIILTNSPYRGGGTHLPDMVTILPVFYEGHIVAFTVNKAHWTEIGGMDTGSLTTRSSEIYQEGLHFRFLKLYEAGELNVSLVGLIRENVRLPDDTLGDMHAGVAAARVGARRIENLIGKYGRDAVLAAMEDLLDYGERMTRQELLKLPEGVYMAEDVIEEDGLGNGPFTIKVAVTLKGGRCIADFSGTSAQAPGPINCSHAGLLTGVRCVFKAVTNPEIPANDGAFRPLEIICPPGTLLTAASPAPVSLYFESLIAAIDVVWKALAPIAPDRLPAGHKRTVGSTFISGRHPDTGELYIMGEPLMGGWGAAPDADGINGMFCCGNGETFNIPVELTEARYGLQVDQYAFHTEPGGEGKFRGGKGVVLDYRVTRGDAFLTIAFSRTRSRPWGLQGGREGSLNYAEVLRTDGSVERHSVATALAVGENEVARLYDETDPYNDRTLRGRALWTPTDNLDVDIKAQYSKHKGKGIGFHWPGAANFEVFGFFVGAAAELGVTTDEINSKGADLTGLPYVANNPDRGRRETVGFSVKLNYDLGFADFKSVTTYDELETSSVADQGPYLSVLDGTQHTFVDVDGWSQELRLTSRQDSPLRWQAGAYYLSWDRLRTTVTGQDKGLGILRPTVVPAFEDSTNPSGVAPGDFLSFLEDSYAWAVFGSIDWDVMERLTLSLAARYDEETREQNVNPYNTAWELGAKMTYGPFRLNLAYFNSTVDNTQYFPFDGLAFVQVFEDIDEGELDGFEIEGVWRVSDNIDVYTAYGQTDGEIT